MRFAFGIVGRREVFGRIRTVVVPVLALLAVLTGIAGEDDNTFESVDAGLKITKPAGWQFLSARAVAQHLAVARLRDKELEKVIRSKPNIPFLVIARFAEPYDGINPSVQVSLKTQGELAGQGAKPLLEHIVERLKSTFTDFTFVEEVKETRLDGAPAARLVAKYTVIDSKGKERKTVARMWVVPRGEYMLTINMYAPQEGPYGSEKEFRQILDSIKLTPNP